MRCSKLHEVLLFILFVVNADYELYQNNQCLDLLSNF